MTKHQKEVYDFIVKYNEENRVIPTSIAIANHIGKTGQRARQIIQELVQAGKLNKTKRYGLYELSTDEE